LEKIPAEDVTGDIQFMTGQALFLTGKYERAISAFEAAAARPSRHRNTIREAYWNAAMSLVEL